VPQSSQRRGCPAPRATDKKEGVLKTLAFLFALFVSAVGVVGMLVPSALVWVARQFVASGGFGFYVVAAVRIAFSLILISAASASRAPKALRVLGFIILILGVTTALTGFVAIGRAERAIEWWLQQGPGVMRLTGLPILILGGFIAFACAPGRTGP
jgi:hypothetical protein